MNIDLTCGLHCYLSHKALPLYTNTSYQYLDFSILMHVPMFNKSIKIQMLNSNVDLAQ